MAYDKNMAVKVVEITPTVDTNAYASGDLVGPKMTLDFGRGGLIQSVTLIDLAKQDASLDIVFFDTDPSGTTFTDNAALDIADADIKNVIGIVNVGTYFDFNDNSAAFERNLAIPFLVDGDDSIYACIVSRATPTYAASDLTLRFGILETSPER